MIISMMLGGIRIPRVPAAAMEPQASALLYPCLSMVGNAMAVIMVTDAPMIPVMAARMVPMTVTARARAPGTFRSMTWTAYSSLSATPLRSIITPMKTNVGTATRIRFSAAWPQIRGTKL